RLDAVGLREPLADGLEHARVRGGVAAAGPADGALVDGDHAVEAGHGPADERTLPRPGHTREHDEHAQGDVDVDVAQVVRAGATHFERPGGRPDRLLERGPVRQVAAGQRVAGPQPRDVARVHHLPALRAGAGPEVDDVV